MIRGIERIDVYEKNKDATYESHIKKKIKLDEFKFENNVDIIDVTCVNMRVKSYNTVLQDYKEFVDILYIERKLNEGNRLIKIIIGNYIVSVTPDHILYVFIKDFPISITADELSEKMQYSIVLIPTTYGLVKIDSTESYEYSDYVYNVKLSKHNYIAYNNIIC